MKRALLIAQGPTSLSALKSLAKTFTVCGMVRHADASDEVLVLADKLGTRIFDDESLLGVKEALTSLRPDVTVISSYNRIIGADLIELCPFVNVHYAELPQYRGRAVVNWAMINEEPQTAITIHEVVPGLDAGNILFQEAVSIGMETTVTELYDKLNAIQQIHLGKVVADYLEGKSGTIQDESLATYACARGPEDGEIDWNESANRIHRLIRALTPPFPGAYTFHKNRQLIVDHSLVVEDPPTYAGRIPGKIIGINKQEGYVDVLAGEGVLRILSVRPPGDNPIPAASVITSTRDKLGLSKHQLLTRILELEKELADVKNRLN